jgi:type IV secretory pathway VirJ component
MKVAAILWSTVSAAQAVPGAAIPGETVNFGRFGEMSIYRGSAQPRDVVLFLSGDGGWNLGVISMARRLTDKGAVVVGIDIRHYLAQLEKSADKCVSPAADFENLSRYLQAKLAFKQYLLPTLVGYSSGATLVYAMLAEAPDGSFKGALSIGFCPDLDLKKPLCEGSGIEATARRDAKGILKGVDLLPAKQLSGKWISLQGQLDQVCPAPATQKFIAMVPGGDIVMLPKVGHGYSVEKNWVPQYEAAYERITMPVRVKAPALAAPIADLPLTVMPAAAAGNSSPWFGVFLSGDGGWVGGRGYHALHGE